MVHIKVASASIWLWAVAVCSQVWSLEGLPVIERACPAPPSLRSASLGLNSNLDSWGENSLGVKRGREQGGSGRGFLRTNLRGGGILRRGGQDKQKEAEVAAAAEAAAAAQAESAAHSGYIGSLAVAFYLFTSLTLTLMNKLIFSQFQFPLVVTEFQVQCPVPGSALIRIICKHDACCILLMPPWGFNHACVYILQLVVSLAMLAVLGEVSSFTGLRTFVPPVRIEMGLSLQILPVRTSPCACMNTRMFESATCCVDHMRGEG